ncbi:MAG: toxin-antitoxin system HicB family antitoxin [Sphingobacteriia bacterium]|nr:toxin-antitoxin system HicB family antitoxin [Sphingobacteriia bacterium]
MSNARKKANEKYIKSQGEIKIRVTKGRKVEIQSHAERQGKSLNGFINEAIDEKMKKGKEEAK